MTLGVLKGTVVPQEVKEVFSKAGITIQEFVFEKVEKPFLPQPSEDGVEIIIEGMD